MENNIEEHNRHPELIGKSFKVIDIRPETDGSKMHEELIGEIGELVFCYEFNDILYYGLNFEKKKNVEFLDGEIELVHSRL